MIMDTKRSFSEKCSFAAALLILMAVKICNEPIIKYTDRMDKIKSSTTYLMLSIS
jgi:hypothetical protein